MGKSFWTQWSLTVAWFYIFTLYCQVNWSNLTMSLLKRFVNLNGTSWSDKHIFAFLNSTDREMISGFFCGSAERRLLNDLMANYQKLERPVANETEPVILKFGLTLQQIMDVVGNFLKCCDKLITSVSGWKKSNSYNKCLAQPG